MIGLEDLETIQLFTELKPSALEAIKDFIMERSFEKGELIFLQDEPCEAIYFVKAGRVRLYRLSLEGKQQTLCIRKPGEYFCPVPILDGEVHLATALAMTKASVYVIRKVNLLCVGQDYPEIMSAMQNACVKEIRRLSYLVEELACKGVKGRLARALLDQSVLEGFNAGGKGKVSLTEEELASLVGTRQEIISRLLRFFKEEGVVRVGRGQIIILDGNRLKEFL